MERRAFVKQCMVLPAMALSHSSATARQSIARAPIRDYCFDGTYAEFELLAGNDLACYLIDSKPSASAFVLRARKMMMRGKNMNLQMEILAVHPEVKPFELSSREYLFRILGVTVQTSEVSPNFPARGRRNYEVTEQQIEKLLSEIWQLNLRHQDVWAEYHRSPTGPIEIDPVTGQRILRN